MSNTNKETDFLEILANHKNQIYRVCWGFVSQADDVNDLFQEVVMNVWKGMDGFRKESAYSTWIQRIAINTCILWKKQDKKKQDLLSSQMDMPQIENEEYSEKENPKIKHLKTAIDKLKKMDRSIILLLLEGLSYKELSEVTGLTVSHVGVRVNRIKKQLKSLMSEKTQK